MSAFAEFVFLACCIGGIICWGVAFVSFIALRRYAPTQGVTPYHAWVLFPAIWRDSEHPMYGHLYNLAVSTGTFVGCVLVGLLVGYLTFPPAPMQLGK